MKEQLDSKEVINSMESLISDLEKLRDASLENEKKHKANRNIVFRHFFNGSAKAFHESADLLADYLDRLIIEN